MAWRGGWGKKDMGYKCADSAVEFDPLKVGIPLFYQYYVLTVLILKCVENMQRWLYFWFTF